MAAVCPMWLMRHGFGAWLRLQVGKVQRQFIAQLLGSSSFSKHLGAVRETNNLLMRALALRNIDDGNSVKVAPPLLP